MKTSCIKVGDQFGSWTVLGKPRKSRCECECKCGRRRSVYAYAWCARERRGQPLIDMSIPWEDDEAAQCVVKRHPSGLTLEQLSSLMGVSRQRVEQIVASALKKCAQRAADSREILRELAAARDERDVKYEHHHPGIRTQDLGRSGW